MTIVVVPTSSFRDGQETLFSSFRTSRTNSTPLLMRSLILSKNSFIDRQSCGAPPLKDVAGQEGLEPPTCGFGDRRSTNSSYWPALNRNASLTGCKNRPRITYLVSLWMVWARHLLQNFFNSRRSVVAFLFLVEV